MTKTIKSLILISIVLFAFLESASSKSLRRSLEESETSFNLEESDNPTTTTDTSDSFVLGEGDSTESTHQATTEPAGNYDLGDADAASAPAPTAGELVGTAATTSTSEGHTDETSFVLGDDDETQTVSNTQKDAATTTESEESDLGGEETVGVSASTATSAGETSFELKEDDSVGVSSSTTTSASETSFELKEDVSNDQELGASNAETSFELDDEDKTNNVDLTDPADASSSTDNSGANNGGRALSSKEDLTVAPMTSNSAANSGVSLQTGIVMSLVAVVSALVL